MSISPFPVRTGVPVSHLRSCCGSGQLPVGQPICGECLLTFTDTSARCKQCALRLDANSSGLCGMCAKPDPWLDSTVAAVDYGYPWNQLIARFKFHGDTAWAHTFAHMMAHAQGASALLELCDTLAPLLTQAPGERGYNKRGCWRRRCARQPAAGLANGWHPLVKIMDTPHQHG